MIGNAASQTHCYLFGISTLRFLLSELASEVMLFGFHTSSTEWKLRGSISAIDRRLEHIAAIHEAVIKLNAGEMFKKSFLPLQAHHVRSIASEVGSLFNHLQNVISDFDQSVAGFLCETQAIIERILSDMQEMIHEQTGEVPSTVSPATDQLSICPGIYNYNAVRKTLHASYFAKLRSRGNSGPSKNGSY